jgi:DNA polymerase (family 10)
MKETIGDIDILVSTDEPDAVTSAIGGLPSVRQVTGSGPTKTSVFTDSGTQVDIRVVAKDEFGAALQYFTGSKEHNVRVREIAVKKGFKLSEYGLFKIDGNERVAAETEEEVYSALGISTPPPTLRENLGEVEKGLENELPKVVELSDIKGDLHSHSTYSDGRVSLEEMSIAAKERGYGYLAITDHGRKLYGVPNLRVEQIEAQRREINGVNERLGDDFRVLHGIELNISADGSLDYPDEVLASFDIVLASVHHGLTADRETITSRVIAAIRHPEVDIFAHPTSRRMRRRGPSQLDLEAVFEEAQRCGVVLEVNASPTRLDLKDDHVRLAIEVGCRIVINTDSHHPSDLDRMELGVGTAQRGWARPSDVVNTLELEDMLKALRG